MFSINWGEKNTDAEYFNYWAGARMWLHQMLEHSRRCTWFGTSRVSHATFGTTKSRFKRNNNTPIPGGTGS